MYKLILKIFSKVGIDGAIAFTLLSRVIQAGGGLLSIIFIARFLSPIEQGYFYTFASIIAVQVFFELGLSGIITQYTAHEFAHLKWIDTTLEGDEFYKSRLSSLLRFCVKWFGIIALVLFFILVIVGFYFFSRFSNETIKWEAPWIILCLSTSLNLFIDPLLSFFDGLGQVKDMAKVRLIQKTAYILLMFIFFLLGFKLYASPLASLLAIVVNYFQIAFSRRIQLLKTIWTAKSTWAINYFHEIFPYQWRIALSWISGYFIFQLFNPVLFAVEGAKVAGQMGMTLQVLNGLSALSMSWINTKVPLLSSHIAKNNFKKLDDIFNITVKQLSIVSFLSIITLVGFVLGIKYYNLPLVNRFLPLPLLLLLSVVTFANQFIFSWATYLRCHKQEPFLLNSVITGVLCILSTTMLGKYFGVYGIVIGYTAIIIIISMPWAYLTFRSKKLEWHT